MEENNISDQEEDNTDDKLSEAQSNIREQASGEIDDVNWDEDEPGDGPVPRLSGIISSLCTILSTCLCAKLA
jgi:hypothetical protein